MTMARRGAIVLLALGSLVVVVGAYLRQKPAEASIGAGQKTTVASDKKEQVGAKWSFGGPLPGATPFDDALVRKLQDAWAGQPRGERPRTRHLNPDGSP